MILLTSGLVTPSHTVWHGYGASELRTFDALAPVGRGPQLARFWQGGVKKRQEGSPGRKPGVGKRKFSFLTAVGPRVNPALREERAKRILFLSLC